MIKYIVQVNTTKVNAKGKRDSKIFDFTFQEESPIDSRKKAIAKVLELEDEFLYGEVKYESFFEANMKDFKNFNAYSINIFFVNSDGCEYCLYGEDEEQTIEALQAEVYHFAEEDNIVLTDIEYADGEWDFVNVIEMNLDFLIN
ncbi:hypothetical protein ADIWIN_1475 [Winogradskyella psychrotolerans RS-3]|uniref:Uncharacterized protein n=1 Tax=Winogradskyella psychrotolerans RS-3 TaxID=641526 RepID=S7VT65_9FLAO|nr:hypothetical protein [Winogradskyella psychrotolerans]EPR73445.1 hypothetical protein ADIWIN_1475 [Winogradskyella psychrotolerans RS-3]